MTSTETPVRYGIECLPGETDEEFIARIVATSGEPDPELADDLRRVLPPVRHRPAATADAA